MIFDEPIDKSRLEQFASQVQLLSPAFIEDLDRSFRKDQSPEFYKGLLTGSVNSYVMVHNKSPGSQEDQLLGALVAYVSDVILKNEWYG